MSATRVEVITSWDATGLPCPQLDGYGYRVDLGLLRTPFAFGDPRQRQLYDTRPRTWSLEWRLTRAQLATAEAWLDQLGFAWFELRLLSAESGSATPTPHRVRLIGDWEVRGERAEYFRLRAQVEMAAADETCSMDRNHEVYTACADSITWVEEGAWPGVIGIDWTTLGATWGDTTDWGRDN